MTSVAAPICLFCTRLTDQRRLNCEAFPEGIPKAILANEADHRAPIEGDHGLQFSPITLDDDLYASSIFDADEAGDSIDAGGRPTGLRGLVARIGGRPSR